MLEFHVRSISSLHSNDFQLLCFSYIGLHTLRTPYAFPLSINLSFMKYRLVPHVDKAPLPLRILRLVTSNFLPVENPTHPTAHAPERASVYILGQFRTSK